MNHFNIQSLQAALVSRSLLMSCLLLLSLVLELSAQSVSTRFWDGSRNDNWRQSKNWDGGQPPTADRRAIFETGISRNDVDLKASNGNDVDREIYGMRLRTEGDGLTIKDYFGPGEDLFANWRMRNGRIVIPENNSFPDSTQRVTWVNTRSDANELNLVADIVLPSGKIIFSAEGQTGYGGSDGSTNSTEILNFYGSLSGEATIELGSNVIGNPSPYDSRLVLYEASVDYTGEVFVRQNGDLYIRRNAALKNAKVSLEQGSIFNIEGLVGVSLGSLDNDSAITIADGQQMSFGSRSAEEHDGVFSGAGSILFNGSHRQLFRGTNLFTGRFLVAGPVRLAGLAMTNTNFALIVDNTLSFSEYPAAIGALSNKGDLVMEGALDLNSPLHNTVYEGDISGSGRLSQNNRTNWTYHGTSSVPFLINRGTFSGNGSVIETRVFNTGSMTPGNSDEEGETGVQQHGSLELDGTLLIDVNSASDYDQVEISGELRLTENAILTIRGPTSLSQTVIIATYDILSGSFEAIDGLPDGVDLKYQWDDGTGNTNNIALVPNIAPVAVDDSVQGEQGEVFDFNPIANDIDGDLDQLTVVNPDGITVGGIGGTVDLVDPESGTFLYFPNGIEVGEATFDYTVEDNNGSQSTATVTIQVNNVLPQAVDDFYDIDEDTILTDVNVVFRDLDAAGEILTVTNAGSFTAGGIGGEVILSADGDLTYTPPANAFGTATFDYEIRDSVGATSSASVEITVESVNDAPSFTLAGGVIVARDAGAQTISSFVTSFSAIDEGQSLDRYEVSASDESLFATLPSLSNDGVLSFVPDGETFGATTVTVTAFDDGPSNNSATQSFTLTITDVDPVAAFSFPAKKIFAGQTVQFTDASSDATAWEWDFDGNGTIDSTAQNPSYIYATAGDYSVSLKVSNSAGEDQTAKSLTICAVGIINGDFSSTMITNGSANQDSLGLGWYAKSADDGSVTNPNWSAGATSTEAPLGVLTRVRSSGSATRIGQLFVNSLTGSNWALRFDLDGRINRIRLFAGTLAENPLGIAFNSNRDDAPNGSLVDANGWTVLMDESNVTADGTVTYNLSEDLGNFDVMVINIRSVSGDGVPVLDNFSFVQQGGPSTVDDSFDLAPGDVISDTVFANDSAAALNAPLAVTAVNGDASSVGTGITLDTGALLTLLADGSFLYDSDGAFDSLAIGATGADTFTYTVGTGSLTSTATVTLNITNPDPVTTFRETYGLAADGSEDAEDWSGNGLPNIYYYAFGLGDPDEAEIDRTRLPKTTREGDNLTFRFLQPIEAREILIEPVVSKDLSTWETVTTFFQGPSLIGMTSEAIDADYQEVIYTLKLTDGQCFFSVRSQMSNFGAF